MSNNVNHPAHYGGADDPFEHIKVCEAMGWGYHLGNCTKYLWRAGKKGSRLEDLRKAAFYLAREIALEEEAESWVKRETAPETAPEIMRMEKR